MIHIQSTRQIYCTIRHLKSINCGYHISNNTIPDKISYLKNTNSETFLSSANIGKNISCTRHNLKQSIDLITNRLFCQSSHDTCWKCHNPIDTSDEFCIKCNTIQKYKEKSHFEQLKVDKLFNLDSNILKKKFRKLQNVFHPDKYTLKTETEQQYASDYSTAINNAYQILNHPLKRAEYLLELHDHSLQEGELSVDQEFLWEVMEINEKILEAGDDKDTVVKIGEKNNLLIETLLLKADAAFIKQDIEEARAIVAKLKYYNRIYEKVKDYERIHGIFN